MPPESWFDEAVREVSRNSRAAWTDVAANAAAARAAKAKYLVASEEIQARKREETQAERRERAKKRGEAFSAANKEMRAKATQAKNTFDAVASGALPPLGAGQPPPWQRMTPWPKTESRESVSEVRTLPGGLIPRGGAGWLAQEVERLAPATRASGGRQGVFEDDPRPRPKPVTPDAALKIILDHIAASSDENLLKVAGEWIGKFTNGVSETIKARDEPED